MGIGEEIALANFMTDRVMWLEKGKTQIRPANRCILSRVGTPFDRGWESQCDFVVPDRAVSDAYYRSPAMIERDRLRTERFENLFKVDRK